MCEELRKRRMDVCCLQEVTLGIVMVKEEPCEKVVKERRRSDRVMTVVMVLEEEVKNYMCVWSTEWQTGCREKAFLR